MNNILSLGKECCGCASCEQICPAGCISLEENNEGFLYPRVDESKCTSCGACVKHCPILSFEKTDKTPEIYAAKYNNLSYVMKSSSGGIFVPLAKNILSKQGIVFGCAFDKSFTAVHTAIENEAELEKLQGSKYVQSDIRGIYGKVKKALKNERFVLFCGTGCQVAGLNAFLQKKYEKLITVDIVCHGVPSPKLFSKYAEYLEGKLGGKLTDYSFRNKEHGWDLFFKASSRDKSKQGYGFFDPYYNAFLTGKTYRESCYACKYASLDRPADITLGDFWGIETLHPEFYDKNGVSLVLVNSEKGKKILNELSDEISLIESNAENAVKLNKNLSAPSPRPKCRDDIYNGIDGDFNKYVKTKLKTGLMLKRRIKRLIPAGLKIKIKLLFKK